MKGEAEFQPVQTPHLRRGENGRSEPLRGQSTLTSKSRPEETQAGMGILHTGKPPSSGPQYGPRTTGVSTGSFCCCLPTAPSQTSPYRRRLHVHDFPAQNNYHSWCFLKGNPSVCNIHLDGAMRSITDRSYGQTLNARTVVADQCPLLCRSSLLCKRKILILMNFLETVCVCTRAVQEGQRNPTI